MRSFSTRDKLGIAGGLLLGIALVTYILEFCYTDFRIAQGGIMRAGGAFFLLWLAWPELTRIPKWAYLSLAVALVVIAFRPQLALFIVPLFILFLITQPSGKNK